MESSSRQPPAAPTGGDPSEDGAAAELPRLTVTQVEQMKVEARVADIYRVLFDAPPNTKSVMLELWRDQHVEYLTKGLRHLAPSFHVLDANRPWLCYWMVHGLALLDETLDDDLENDIVDFLSRCQDIHGGYGGGPGQLPHLATSYAAVNTLVTIGSERALSSINRDTLYKFMLRMKDKSGAFRMHDGGEIDVRACYTAISVTNLVNILDADLAKGVGNYIASCQTYEGGIAGEPYAEAHGGYTYCGLAAMVLLNEVEKLDLPSLIGWVAFRQGVECGFQGRTNKLVDGCYSFWQGAAIALAQKLMTVVGEQSKSSYSSQLSSVDDACGTSSSGLASEKSSIDSGDELNCSNSGDKRHHKSYFAPPTKNGKADGAAFSSVIEYYMPKKPGERARKPVELNRRTVRQNTTDNKLSDMDGRRLGLKICSKIRQKNNNVGLKGMSDKRHTEDDAFEIFPKRFGNSKNQTYQCEMLNKRDKNKEVVLLDDEDAEPAKSVDVEMANEWDKKSEIYYPSRADPESVVLTYSDIECLKPAVFLKSPVINFYIQYLKRSWPCGDLYIFSTYLYSKLEKALLSRKGDCDSQFEKLRRWWKSVDIFRTPYLLLPIHGEMHWSLVIICMPTKERESGPTVFHLDSLGLHPSDKIFRVIESYLKEEWSYLQKDPSYDIPFSGTIWRHLPRNIHTAKVEVPRQRNDYDCGIFMLYYIEKFIQEAPDRLTRERPCKFGRKWFNPEETWGLRERMRALLFDVFQNTPLNDRDSESHSNDHSEGDDKDEVRTVTIIS